MLAVAVEALDDRALGVGHGASVHIAVDGGVGDAHFLLIRLSLEKPGGGSLVPDGLRRVEIVEKFKDLGHAQIGDGVEVGGSVAPLGAVAHERLAAVARSGDEPVLGGSDGVKRRHTKARGNVRHGGVIELYARLFQRRDESAARFREIHGAVGNAILLGYADRVVRVAAVVLRRGAGQENAHGVAARLLAENADERAVLAAAVAVNDALAAAFFQQLPDKGNAVFEFLFVVAHNECPPFRECAAL